MKNIVLSAALLAALACTSCATKPTPTADADATQGKIVIYQMMVRVFGNDNTTNIYNGTREQNGCGRMSDITPEALQSIRRLGCNYVWYTGILQQATKTDWSQYGLPRQTAAVVKGNAGSPYAICDYYAVSADIADDVNHRTEEFEALVKRSHDAGLKVVMDFVPNHVAREYHSISCPEGVEDLGAGDKTDEAFNIDNNFYYFPGQTLVWNEVKDESAKAKKNTKNADSYVEKPAKVTGNDVFGAVTPSPYDWYETIKLNYGVDYKADGTRVKAWENADGTITIPSTWVKMSDILLYWCSKGVDAFRCDMSEMVPYEFWHYGIGRVKEQYPDVLFIAEFYNPRVYEDYIVTGGFDYLYDTVELYDSIRSVPHAAHLYQPQGQRSYAQLPREPRRAAYCLRLLRQEPAGRNPRTLRQRPDQWQPLYALFRRRTGRTVDGCRRLPRCRWSYHHLRLLGSRTPEGLEAGRLGRNPTACRISCHPCPLRGSASLGST